MYISHSHRFIFIHIAKVAGLSIKQGLSAYAGEPEVFKIRRPAPLLDGKPNRLYQMWEAIVVHATAAQIKHEMGAAFDEYYKFTFVRNPWDWQVSMYHFLLKETTNPHHEKIKAMRGFDEYLEWIVQTEERTPYPKYATKYQKDMLVDETGALLVDFIGRYETLAEDFAHICHILGIGAQLPHLNKSQHRDYRTYYNAHSRDLVAAHFRADIELLGYHFSGYDAAVGGMLRAPPFFLSPSGE
jgi:hypothetical protein